MKRRARVKQAKKRKRARRRRPRLRRLITNGFLAAVAASIVLLIVYAVMGGGGHPDFVPEIAETRSESEGQPFQGGPRLHFPVASIDMGRVPLNTDVRYAFTMTNVGDDAARIEDVDVSVLEGC